MSYRLESNYKRLGDYIKRISNRNKSGEVSNLQGININKHFMPSVANIIGTNLKRYKIVEPNQFACNRMHVGRDYRLPIAVSKFDNSIIVSPAYDVFKIKDENELNIDYLMMWVSRAEFDRNCWFYTDTDIRGKLGWDSFCDMRLPIPSIEKQNEIVKEYNTIVNRIALNETLNQKLEETAQALYKHWFVDFEFPNEDGEPYKSSGGEMVYCEEVDGEVPEGFKIIPIKEFCHEMRNGATPNRGVLEYWNKPDIPWLKTGEVSNNIVIKSEEYISKKGFKNSSTKVLPIDTVLMAMYGATAGQIAYLKFETTTNQACCGMICKSIKEASYLYYYFLVNQKEIANMATGGAQPNLSKNLIEDLLIILPTEKIMCLHPLDTIIEERTKITKENELLRQLQEFILGRMTHIETALEGLSFKD